jgi:3-hydroxyacyl-[acyl-carrier-protein] dehydratase
MEVEKMGAIDIHSVLPHRYPFLLIDKVVSKEELKYAKGIKVVSTGDWFINREEKNPRMPEVLILEAIGQLGAFVLPDKEKSLGLLSGVRNVKFLQSVHPGDQLDLEFEVIKLRSQAFKGRGTASVNGIKVAEAEEITVSYLR